MGSAIGKHSKTQDIEHDDYRGGFTELDGFEPSSAGYGLKGLNGTASVQKASVYASFIELHVIENQPHSKLPWE